MKIRDETHKQLEFGAAKNPKNNGKGEKKRRGEENNYESSHLRKSQRMKRFRRTCE